MNVVELIKALKTNYSVFFAAHTAKLRELATALFNHVNFKGNPHGVTATDVNLGNLPNYPVATEEEAAKGESQTSLLTPYLAAKLVASQTTTDADIEDLVTALTAAFKEATLEIEQA